MSKESTGGGLGLVTILLLVALVAHLLGYSQVATVSFWLALGLVAVVVVISFAAIIVIALLGLTEP